MLEEKTATADTIKRAYTVEDIQEILSVSKTTVYTLVRSKQFHSVRVGGQFRISKRSFDNWLDGKNGGGF